MICLYLENTSTLLVSDSSNLASIAPCARGRRRGLCKDVVFELDLERYEPEQGEGSIECCTKCREDFESDEEVQVDADLIDPALFSRFREWAVNNRESSEAQSD